MPMQIIPEAAGQEPSEIYTALHGNYVREKGLENEFQ